MKRLFYLAVLSIAAVIIAAPLGVSFTSQGSKVVSNVASAAAADNFLPSPGCVQIAIPLINGGGTCVDNTTGGGAIVNYLRGWLLLLSGLVGMVVMVMIVVSGVQYITSTGDPGLVKAAKKRIFDAILALLLYLMMFAILQFLIPGGIL